MQHNATPSGRRRSAVLTLHGATDKCAAASPFSEAGSQSAAALGYTDLPLPLPDLMYAESVPFSCCPVGDFHCSRPGCSCFFGSSVWRFFVSDGLIDSLLPDGAFARERDANACASVTAKAQSVVGPLAAGSVRVFGVTDQLWYSFQMGYPWGSDGSTTSLANHSYFVEPKFCICNSDHRILG